MSRDKAGERTNPMVSQALRERDQRTRTDGLRRGEASRCLGRCHPACFLKEQRGLTLATVHKLAKSLGLTLCPNEPESRNH